MEKMIEKLPDEFNIGTSSTDPLYLRLVRKAPLQDDPTSPSIAFYLIVRPDPAMEGDTTHWRMPVTAIRRAMLGVNEAMPMPEVGGDYLMINFFHVEGWLPVQSNRDVAYTVAGLGLRKLERCFGRVAHSAFFNGISTDDGLETTDGNWSPTYGHDGCHFKVGGGENTWLPQLYMRFHVYSRISRDYWNASI